jgi:hypothetical protein
MNKHFVHQDTIKCLNYVACGWMTSNDELDGTNEGIRTASNIRQDMKPLSQVLIPRHS